MRILRKIWGESTGNDQIFSTLQHLFRLFRLFVLVSRNFWYSELDGLPRKFPVLLPKTPHVFATFVVKGTMAAVLSCFIPQYAEILGERTSKAAEVGILCYSGLRLLHLLFPRNRLLEAASIWISYTDPWICAYCVGGNFGTAEVLGRKNNVPASAFQAKLAVEKPTENQQPFSSFFNVGLVSEPRFARPAMLLIQSD